MADLLDLKADARLIEAQAYLLRPNPFSSDLREQAEQACATALGASHIAAAAPAPALNGDAARDAWVPHASDAEQSVARGARLFKQVSADAGLEGPLRHALLESIDRALARTTPAYAAAGAPLCKLAALEVWQGLVFSRALDALAKAETGAQAIALTPAEVAIERQQLAFLAQFMPGHAAARAALLGAHDMAQAGPRDMAQAWPRDMAEAKPRAGMACARGRTSFRDHLRRILFFTLDATLSAAELRTLAAFFATPPGRACLTTLTAQGSATQKKRSRPAPVADPPEMTDLQATMRQMMAALVLPEPHDKCALGAVLVERMHQSLHENF